MKILIGGDISVRASRELFANKQTKALFNNITDISKEADEFIVNLECAITESENSIKKFGPALNAPLGTCDVMKDLGVTLCALSNNHIFDYGKKGIKDTLAALDKYCFQYTGFGENEAESRKNYYIKRDGKTVAIVNVCEHEYSYALPDRMGARAYDPYDTNDDIVEAKKNADFVIVIYHGGKEYSRYPSPRLVKACRSMVKHGADAVLCQHSHCIGCEEWFEGGYILYGQGNFHFVYDISAAKDDSWKTGLLIELELIDKISVKRIPVVTEGLGMRLANENEWARLISELEERSLSIADGSYHEKFRKFCETLDFYKFIPEEKADLFSHYLDCEAHTDVWREVYRTWNWTNEK